jgi:putative flippase GtrA
MPTPDPLVRAPVRAPAHAPVRPAGRRRRLAVWLRYCAVSAVSTGTSLTTLGVLVGVAGVDATVANVVATAVGTIPSFELNRRWVWAHHGRRSVIRQVVPFVALSFAGLVLSTLAVHVAAIHTADWSRGWRTVAVEAANVAAYGALWILQFFVLDRVLFAHRDSQEALSSVEADSQGGGPECAHGNDPGPTSSRQRAAGNAPTAAVASRPIADRPVTIRG